MIGGECERRCVILGKRTKGAVPKGLETGSQRKWERTRTGEGSYASTDFSQILLPPRLRRSIPQDRELSPSPPAEGIHCENTKRHQHKRGTGSCGLVVLGGYSSPSGRGFLGNGEERAGNRAKHRASRIRTTCRTHGWRHNSFPRCATESVIQIIQTNQKDLNSKTRRERSGSASKKAMKNLSRLENKIGVKKGRGLVQQRMKWGGKKGNTTKTEEKFHRGRKFSSRKEGNNYQFSFPVVAK